MFPPGSFLCHSNIHKKTHPPNVATRRKHTTHINKKIRKCLRRLRKISGVEQPECPLHPDIPPQLYIGTNKQVTSPSHEMFPRLGQIFYVEAGHSVFPPQDHINLSVLRSSNELGGLLQDRAFLNKWDDPVKEEAEEDSDDEVKIVTCRLPYNVKVWIYLLARVGSSLFKVRASLKNDYQLTLNDMAYELGCLGVKRGEGIKHLVTGHNWVMLGWDEPFAAPKEGKEVDLI
ncbi:hypothetical protein PQX77_022245 [Marasmius sp. AFHP31]|nr:hypothetical protein PQX77_022245 [Marasmius sp. AFHP31]